MKMDTLLFLLMPIITQQQAINNATQLGGMTIQNWHDLIDSVKMNSAPEYSRTYFKNIASIHGALWGDYLKSYLLSVEYDGDPLESGQVAASWVSLCTQGMTPWINILRSLDFSGGGGTPIDGIFTPPFAFQFV
jgi:hypothetical protein